MQGADVGQLRELASQMRLSSRRLTATVSELTAGLMSTPWQGPDADDFRSQWQSHHRQALARVAEQLSARGDELIRQADQQEQTSSVGGAPHAPSRPSGPHTPGLPTSPTGPHAPGLPTSPSGPAGPFGPGGIFGPGSNIHLGAGGEADPWKVNLLPGASLDMAKGDHFFTDKNTTNDPNSTTPHVRVTLASGEFALGPDTGEVSASVSANGIEAEASGRAQAGLFGEGKLRVGDDGLSATGALVAGVALSGSGSVALAEHLAVKGSAKAQGGAVAQGTARVNTEGVHADGEVFAGARIEGKAGVDVGGVTVGGKASGWIGVGAEGSLDFGFSDGKLKIGASAGAALGIGGSIGFNLEIDVAEVVDTVTDAAEAVGDFFKGLF